MSLLSIPIFWVVDLYGIAHVWLGVPLASLREPFVVLSIPILLVGPSMYLANQSREELRLKRRTVIAGLFMWSSFICGVYYAVKFGIMEAEAAIPMYLMSTIGAGVASFGGYHIRKKLDG